MAIPTFVASGTGQAGAAALTVNWPASHQADDIGLLVVQTANQVVAAPSGWTEVLDSPQGTGTAGAAGATRLSVFWKRATSSGEAAASVADSGDHQAARILVFRGCDPTAPFDVTAGDVQASADTTVEVPGDTTTVADCLIVLMASNATDTASSEHSSTFTNAGLANIAGRSNTNVTSGVGGGYVVVTGEKATAGAFGTSTGTLVTASAQARLMLALKPPAGGAAPGNGGFLVATGVKPTAGAIGTSTATLQTASIQARIVIALKPPVVVSNNPPVLATLVDRFVTVDTELEFTATATDPDVGDTLTFSLHPGSTVLPGDAVIDPTTGLFQWTPLLNRDEGVWNIIIRVTDAGGLFDEQAITITVREGVATASDVATRAATDTESAQALVELLLAQEQMNSAVLHQARSLLADLLETKAYLDLVLLDLQT